MIMQLCTVQYILYLVPRTYDIYGKLQPGIIIVLCLYGGSVD